MQHPHHNRSWPKSNQTLIDEYCHSRLPDAYESYWYLGTYSSLAVVGVFYALLGYRWWRLNMFVTSFSLGSLLLYIILSTQPTMNESQLIGVSCSIATLFGLIGALLQYVGLFVNGFCFGLTLSIVTFIFLDMKNQADDIVTSFWLPIGLILLLGLVCATLTLRFQKSMLIISSSCLAGLCETLALDYFLQASILLCFTHRRLLFEHTPALYIRHWIVGLILPIVMLFGMAMQFFWTGKNFNHRDAWHKAISAGKKRYKSANLNKIRRHYHPDTLREQIIPDESNRFRYFYHIRRANGDALSSDFIQNVRQQSSSAVHLTNRNNNDSDPTRAVVSLANVAAAGPIAAKTNTDSATTTLTHLM